MLRRSISRTAGGVVAFVGLSLLSAAVFAAPLEVEYRRHRSAQWLDGYVAGCQHAVDGIGQDLQTLALEATNPETYGQLMRAGKVLKDNAKAVCEDKVSERFGQ